MLHAAEFDQRVAPRFFGVHSRAQIVLDVQLEMAFHLRGEFAFAALLMEQAGQPKKPCTQMLHCVPRFMLAGLKSGHYDHSWRNAVIGSTRVARRAGTYAANIATMKMAIGTMK